MRNVCANLLVLAIFALPGAPPTRAADTNVLPPAKDVSVIPSAVDLRPAFQKFQLTPRLQGSRPTCSVFTIAGALEFALAQREGHTPRLSVEFLNWAANQERGVARDGGFFSDLLNGFAAHGICTESNMLYASAFDPKRQPESETVTDARSRATLGLREHWIKKWDVKTGLTDDEFNRIKSTIAQGWPVCGGMRWPKREKWIENVLQTCPASEVFDGHSILLLGWRDDPAQPGGGVFMIRNTGRGRDDGQMPYAYAREFMNDAVWVDSGARDGDSSSVKRHP